MLRAIADGSDERMDDADDVVEAAFQLSQLLKKSHDGRTAAIFTDDSISEHILREAERAALDPNMLLSIYVAVVTHVLNPCERSRSLLNLL